MTLMVSKGLGFDAELCGNLRCFFLGLEEDADMAAEHSDRVFPK